jgi:hypothetical protein
LSGRFRGIQQKNSIIYYPELTATVKIAYIKKSTGFQGIPLDSYIPAGIRPEYVGKCKGLHQLIKGAFKDQHITWVNDHITVEYPASEAQKIFNNIDRW